jgi:hypothetical protein
MSSPLDADRTRLAEMSSGVEPGFILRYMAHAPAAKGAEQLVPDMNMTSSLFAMPADLICEAHDTTPELRQIRVAQPGSAPI